MNLDILKRLSTRQLQELREAADKEIYLRIDFSVAVGRFGSFTCGKGFKRTVRVERINPITISVIETPTSHVPGCRWKVAKSMLSMEGVEIANRIKPTAVEVEQPHKLQTKSDMVW